MKDEEDLNEEDLNEEDLNEEDLNEEDLNEEDHEKDLFELIKSIPVSKDANNDPFNSVKEFTGSIVDYIVDDLPVIVEFIARYIREAKRSIHFVTSYWEGSSMSAAVVKRALQQAISGNKHIEIRIVLDNGKMANFFAKDFKRVIHRVDWERELNLELQPAGRNIAIMSYHRPLMGTMHAKFLVVDDHLAVLCSNNIQDRPNLEMAVCMSGDIVSGFIECSRYLWKDVHLDLHLDLHANLFSCIISGSLDTFSSSVEVEQSFRDSAPEDGRSEKRMIMCNRDANGSLWDDVLTPQNHVWWTCMSLAKRKILIVTPTFNAYHAKRSVYLACCRGVHVTLLLTKYFNDKKEALPLQGGTNTQVVAELLQKLKKKQCEGYLSVKWFKGKNEEKERIGVNNHVKYMCIDDTYFMIGNGNMDTQSWYHSMEVNVLIRGTSALFAERTNHARLCRAPSSPFSSATTEQHSLL
jgi:hypothetical protein